MTSILYIPRVVTGLTGALLEPIQSPAGNLFAIRVSDDLYLSVQPNGELQTRTAIGPWETGTRVTPDLLQYIVEGKVFYIAIQVPVSEPVPIPPQPPVDNPHHVGPGPLTADRAHEVVNACAAEFPQLLVVFSTDEAAVAACEEFLLRVIWHLQLAGFEAARQKNPSGAISDDKLCILIDTEWLAYDIMSMGYANHATTVQFMLIGGANPVSDPGLAD